jgi:hypothetical protein
MVAVVAMLLAAGAAQAALVDLSLEPSTSTVNVGDPFSLEFWMRSDPTGQSNDGADVNLLWDPSYVRLDGLVEDGDYDWMMAFFTDDDFSDGTAAFTLFAQFSGDRPQTDLHAVTLNFTALAVTDSTPVTIPAASVAWQGEDITGTLTGEDIQIVPEPCTMALLALGGLALLRRKRGYGG